MTDGDWRHWLESVTIERGSLRFENAAIVVLAKQFLWDPKTRSAGFFGVNVAPVAGKDSFWRAARWQTDYIHGSAGSIAIKDLIVESKAGKRAFVIGDLSIEAPVVEAFRDKRMPFRHGVEKPMPTQLLVSTLPDVSVHQAKIANGTVVYNELSALTGRWSRISFSALSGTIRHLTTRGHAGDTLVIDASAGLFGGYIRRFQYKEAYGDSLSRFEARAEFSPFELTRLSELSSPIAAVSITTGRVDTAWSVWRGNRYAAYGFIDFRYRDLRVKIQNKKDDMRGGFVPAIETLAANLVLPNRSRRASVLFFQRDREKFIFNFWAKTQASGIAAALIHKKESAYKEMFAEKWQVFQFPFDGLSRGPW